MSSQPEQDFHVHGNVEKLTLIRSVLGDVNIQEGKIVVVADRDVYINIQKQQSIQELKHIPPTPPELLLGRSQVYEQVLASVYENKQVLLHGMGGMGKTAVAQTISATLLTDNDKFDNGVLWLTVLGAQLEDLLDDVLIEEGKSDAFHLTKVQKSKLVRRLLGAQKLLIVLDDVDEDNDRVVREWIRNVHPPSTPLLITSRSKLQAHDAYYIGELPREDSRRLLKYYSGVTASQNLTFETSNQIASSLGDHPLALHLMAYHIAVYYEDAPERVLKQLEVAHENIKKISRGNDKDDNVFVSMDLSWRKLSEQQQKLLSILAAFPASSTGDEILIQATKLRQDDYETTIAELKKVSLINQQLSGKWSNHALIKAYVEAKLSETGTWNSTLKGVVDTCAWYIAENADHNRLEQEVNNLLEAFQIAYRNDWGINLFDGLVWMLNERGYYRQGVVFLSKFIKKLEAYPQQQDRLTHLANLQGLFYYRLGDYPEAAQAFQQALAVAVKIGSVKQSADALGNLGMLFSSLEDYEEALKYLQAQNELLLSIGPHPAYGNSLVQIGTVFKNMGRFDIAVQFYKKAIAFYEEIGRPDLAEGAHSNWEAIKMFQNAKSGKLPGQSIELYEKQLKLYLESNNRYQAAVTMHNLAIAHLIAGNVRRFFELIKRGRELAVEIDAKPLIEAFDKQLAKFDGINPDDIVRIEFNPKTD